MSGSAGLWNGLAHHHPTGIPENLSNTVKLSQIKKLTFLRLL